MDKYDPIAWQGRDYKQIKSDYKLAFWSVIFIIVIISIAVLYTLIGTFLSL